MVEEMMVKLVEKMEMVGGGDGRPKEVWLFWVAGNKEEERKEMKEKERKKRGGWLYIRERNYIIFPYH